MFKYTLTINDYVLILVNLVPLAGVLFNGWDAHRIFLCYCLETLLIGIFNVIKMIIVYWFSCNNNTSTQQGLSLRFAIFLILFFILHYGMFVFIQTQVFFNLTNVVHKEGLFAGYTDVRNALGNEGIMLLAAMFIYHSFAFMNDFLRNGMYRSQSMELLMVLPYPRIFVQQLVVVLGGLFLTTNTAVAFIVLFVVLKTIIELALNSAKVHNMLSSRLRVAGSTQQ